MTDTPKPPMTEVHPTCDRCREPIDPSSCWCGDPINKHCGYWSNHAAIPMGCICGYSDLNKKREADERIRKALRNEQ